VSSALRSWGALKRLEAPHPAHPVDVGPGAHLTALVAGPVAEAAKVHDLGRETVSSGVERSPSSSNLNRAQARSRFSSALHAAFRRRTEFPTAIAR